MRGRCGGCGEGAGIRDWALGTWGERKTRGSFAGLLLVVFEVVWRRTLRGALGQERDGLGQGCGLSLLAGCQVLERCVRGAFDDQCDAGFHAGGFLE